MPSVNWFNVSSIFNIAMAINRHDLIYRFRNHLAKEQIWGPFTGDPCLLRVNRRLSLASILSSPLPFSPNAGDARASPR